MIKETKKENLLISWKEIASYLDCNVRTCLRWEKNHSLPVHRIDPPSRSSVFAYKEELDKWLVHITKNKSVRRRLYDRDFTRNKDYLYIFAITAAVVFLIILSFFGPGAPRIPADFKISDSKLVILDSKGKELWSYDTGIENLMSGESYKEHFQYVRRIEGHDSLPQLMMKDISDDGKVEVLFSVQTQDDFNEGELICFSNTGDRLWTFTGGRKMTFGKKSYSPDYRIHGFDVCDLNGDGELETIIISDHRFFFPTQLVVLNPEGLKTGEYWNAGRINDIAFADLDEDGKLEIVCAGCNNEYNKGCIFVFDPLMISGRSPQGADFRCSDLEEGSEKYYILLPRTDVDKLESPIETITSIDLLKNRQLSFKTNRSEIYFQFNCGFEIQHVMLSHRFEQKHKEALMSGKINSRLDDTYRQNLYRDVLYYDGDKWVPEATMNLNWRK